MAGERLVAIIVPRNEMEDSVSTGASAHITDIQQSLVNPQATTDLISYLKTKLGAYKIPRTYIIVDTIARNAVGKVSVIVVVVVVVVVAV